MKRDMDLVRAVLLATEGNPSPDEELDNLEIDGHDAKAIAYHVQLLAHAGLLTAVEAQTIGIYEWHPVNLTWEGHDFLDSIRDPDVWRKTKESATAAGGFTFDLLKELAKGFLKKQIKDRTGIDV